MLSSKRPRVESSPNQKVWPVRYFGISAPYSSRKRASECAAKASRQPSPAYPAQVWQAHRKSTPCARQILRTVASIAGSPAASEYRCAWASPLAQPISRSRSHGSSGTVASAPTPGRTSKASSSERKSIPRCTSSE